MSTPSSFRYAEHRPAAARDQQQSRGCFGASSVREKAQPGSSWVPTGATRSGSRNGSVAGGTVITVHGIGRETSEDGTERTVHDALAVIHLDHDRATALMRAYTAADNWQDMDLTLLDEEYDWEMDDPRAGRIRYEGRIDAEDRCTENAYMTRDGAEPHL